MPKTIRPEDQYYYDQCWSAMIVLAFNGTRFHYPHPTIFKDTDSGQTSATLFSIKRCILSYEFDELLDMEFGPYKNRKKFSENYVSSDVLMKRLCSDIYEKTKSEPNVLLNERIDHAWPFKCFEQWLDANHKTHWMTASFNASQDDSIVSGDTKVYTLLTQVHAPIHLDPEQYEREWGENFTMLKLSM